MKLVQIDNKTIIEVDGRISDHRAREEYLEKIGRKIPDGRVPHVKANNIQHKTN